jgi:Ca2+-binding RTX toxin-like protein
MAAHRRGSVKVSVQPEKDWLEANAAQRGADTVYGGTYADAIFDGQGADRIFGGAGRDTIYDGPGADADYAGPGQDYIGMFNDGPRDTVSCARGYDVVYGANGNTIRDDCEEVHGRQS